jgi:hypothetical protein
VDAAGGTVSGASARLSVPAGALGSSVALTLRNTSSGPLDPSVALGSAVELSPAGTSFASAATLTLSYAAAQLPLGIDPGELRLHVLEAGEWQLVPGGASDSGAREVSAPIRKAGTFAARWVPGPSASCSGPAAHEFDFWLGHWNLVVPSGVAGTNDITRHDCVLEEEFHEVSGTIGRSVSFLSALDGRWYQTYRDSRGNGVRLGGGREGDAMLLYAEGSGGSARSALRPLDPDRVRFSQETLSGATWRASFDSTYVRR